MELAKHSPSVHFAYLALAERADPMARNLDTALKLIREAMALCLETIENAIAAPGPLSSEKLASEGIRV
jgi:hypothetical protein